MTGSAPGVRLRTFAYITVITDRPKATWQRLNLMIEEMVPSEFIRVVCLACESNRLSPSPVLSIISIYTPASIFSP